MTRDEIEAMEVVRFMNFHWSEKSLAKSWQVGARSNPEGPEERNRRFVFTGVEALIYETLERKFGEILIQASRAGYALGRRLAGGDVERDDQDETIFWITLPSSVDPNRADLVHMRYNQEGHNEPVSVSLKTAIIHNRLIKDNENLISKVAQEAYIIGRNLALAEKK